MKLHDIHEQVLSYSPIDYPSLLSKVKRRIDKGDSRLKTLLSSGIPGEPSTNLYDVARAIKVGKCMANPKPGEKDLGPTYLEQTISNILRDMVTNKEWPEAQLNDARIFFGLSRLSRKQLKKEIKIF